VEGVKAFNVVGCQFGGSLTGYTTWGYVDAISTGIYEQKELGQKE